MRLPSEERFPGGMLAQEIGGRYDIVGSRLHRLRVRPIFRPLIRGKRRHEPEREEQNRPNREAPLQGLDRFPEQPRGERPSGQEQIEREKRKREPGAIEDRDQAQKVERPEHRVGRDAPASRSLAQEHEASQDREDSPENRHELAQIAAKMFHDVLRHDTQETARVEKHDIGERVNLSAPAVEEFLPVPFAVDGIADVHIVRVREWVPGVRRVDEEPRERGKDESRGPDSRSLHARGAGGGRRLENQEQKERARPEEEAVVSRRERPSSEGSRSQDRPDTRRSASKKERKRSQHDREKEHVRPDLVRVGQERWIREKEEEAREGHTRPEEASMDAIEEPSGENR